MKPNYVIRTSRQAFEAFARATNLDYEVETEFPLFDLKVVSVEPLQPPAGKIFHTPLRYNLKQ